MKWKKESQKQQKKREYEARLRVPAGRRMKEPNKCKKYETGEEEFCLQEGVWEGLAEGEHGARQTL